MSAWVVGLALSAGYLINKNLKLQSVLESAQVKYNTAAQPAEKGVTTAEVRKAWANTEYTRYGDMSEKLSQAKKQELDQKVQAQQQQVQEYDAPQVPQIQGVMMTFDRLGY